MTILACMKCFSRKIKRLIRDDVNFEYFPLIMDWYCEECNYRGLPIVFLSEDEYIKFITLRDEYKIDRNKKD
ncbi:MAG: hypothetical protein DRO90_01705 [Candidatus Altiarchaeales archaeon]|nr:MAG: hypothetical protein DRO94_03750 [Candidatus Altiarchaeales archaeon]RLI94643.1 MAG: hypothetical protein DRO90_01705 [Candidatus Altiarchaeales archaeon]HDO82831.1 hypothetical protein [Candidatus Altiarchaeales archaeon]HEX55480.1 hypothetical protein [Candidatus Altiarchaeales archaeon]